MSALGTEPTIIGGQSASALPLSSDVDLLGNGQGIIYFDAQVSNGAFNLRVPKQELDGP